MGNCFFYPMNCGGGWWNSAGWLQSTIRFGVRSDDRFGYLGFRLVRENKAPRRSIIRGGGWGSSTKWVLSIIRVRNRSDDRLGNLGFRLVRENKGEKNMSNTIKYNLYGPGNPEPKDTIITATNNSQTIIITPANQSTSPTAGVKHDQEKPDMSLLSSIAIAKMAEVMTFGKKKYTAHNWRGGISYSRLLAAALRHTFSYLGGESKDPESGISHLAHAMCCLMMTLEFEVTKPELDDRYKNEK